VANKSDVAKICFVYCFILFKSKFCCAIVGSTFFFLLFNFDDVKFHDFEAKENQMLKFWLVLIFVFGLQNTNIDVLK